MEVDLAPPLLGTRHTPMKLVGPADIHIESTGLRVRAAPGALPGRAYALFFGSLAIGVAGFGLALKFSQSSDLTTGIGALALTGFISALLTMKRVPKGDVQTYLFPWENIDAIKWDQCLLVVVKKMKPKGALHINVPPNSDLERELGKAYRDFLRAEQQRNKA